MSITAKRGEFVIQEQAAPRKVANHPRRTASTFSPSASTSRLGITDSGQRYEVRLTRGRGDTEAIRVQIRLNGGTWRFLSPLEGEPFALSFQRRRAGEEIKFVAFDMIAASRGRILAKEKGTDRFFHVILDPLFRTDLVRDAAGAGTTTGRDGGEPWVPSNYIKLDPEFFTNDDHAGFDIPPSLLADYGRHPAAERFGVIVKQMRAEASDMMAVPVTPRTWHLIDTRSPLKIVDLADLNCIGDREVKEVVTKARIRRILEIFYTDNRDEIVQAVMAFLSAAVADAMAGTPGLGSAIRSPLDLAADQVRSINRLVRNIRNAVGSVFGLLDAILDATSAIAGALDDLDSAIRSRLAAVQRNTAEFVVGLIADAVAPALIDWIATTVRGNIARNEGGGFGALLAPLWIVGGLLAWKLEADGIIKIVPAAEPPRAPTIRVPLDVDAWLEQLRRPGGRLVRPGRLPALSVRRRCSPRSELAVDIDKAMKILAEDDNKALRDLIDTFVATTRKHRDVTIPNAPPAELPTFRDVVYGGVVEVSLPGREATTVPTGETYERRAIAFSRVLDLGVGTVHWNEHWQESFGGEMHSIFARRPMFQQEQFGLALYRFMNGPVIDGDGWQDGTTNFYILVKLARKHGQDDEAPRAGRRDYALLFLDEQTYFTQRWRLVHPRKDTAGDVFSLASQLGANPEYFRFDINHYWDPFEDGCIDARSRMALSRQILAVSGRDPRTRRDEIYTFCFAWGLSDRTWRWRALPEARVAVVTQDVVADEGRLPRATRVTVYPMTLGLREDATIHLRGWGRTGRGLVPGRYFQKYLPANCRHAPMAHELDAGKPATGFVHPWDFVEETTYTRMNGYYQFGVYEDVVDARCQFYELEILPDERGDLPPLDVLTARVWYNVFAEGQRHPPLRIDTINVNWQLPPAGEPLRVSDVTEDNSTRPSMSRYEQLTAFRIVQRRPHGLIAVFRDKRDDDLQAASHLPQITHLYSIGAPGMEWRTLTVVVRANHRITRPPVVPKVSIDRVVRRGATAALQIRFWTPLEGDEATRSLWRFSIAGFNADGAVETVIQQEIHGAFTRTAQPDAPLPVAYSMADVIDRPEREYVLDLTNLSAAAVARIDRLCTPQGRISRGTSCWFEDIVGHVATPDQITFGQVS